MRQRAWAVVVVLALMSAGCGARHSAANRQLALKAALGQGNAGSSGSTRAEVEGTTADDSTGTDVASGDAAAAGGASSAGGVTTGASGGSGATGSGGSSGSGATGA